MTYLLILFPLVMAAAAFAVPSNRWRPWLLPLVLVTVFLVLLMRSQASPGTPLSYSHFLGKVNTGQVKTVDINDKGTGIKCDPRKIVLPVQPAPVTE